MPRRGVRAQQIRRGCRGRGRSVAIRVPASLRSLDAVRVASAPAPGEALDCPVTYDKRTPAAEPEAGPDAFAPGVTGR